MLAEGPETLGRGHPPCDDVALGRARHPPCADASHASHVPAATPPPSPLHPSHLPSLSPSSPLTPSLRPSLPPSPPLPPRAVHRAGLQQRGTQCPAHGAAAGREVRPGGVQVGWVECAVVPLLQPAAALSAEGTTIPKLLGARGEAGEGGGWCSAVLWRSSWARGECGRGAGVRVVCRGAFSGEGLAPPSPSLAFDVTTPTPSPSPPTPTHPAASLRRRASSSPPPSHTSPPGGC